MELKQALEEHRGCMKVLDEVEEFLHRRPERGWLSGVAGRLRTLNATLRAHFKGEEEGLFRKLPLDYPRLAPRFEKLEQEHASILESLKAAITSAEGSSHDSGGDRSRQLISRVQRLVATLRRHEAEENELIMEAHWTSVGVSD